MKIIGGYDVRLTREWVVELKLIFTILEAIQAYLGIIVAFYVRYDPAHVLMYIHPIVRVRI